MPKAAVAPMASKRKRSTKAIFDPSAAPATKRARKEEVLAPARAQPKTAFVRAGGGADPGAHAAAAKVRVKKQTAAAAVAAPAAPAPAAAARA